MIGFSILNEVFSNLIATGLVKQVYHSVIIRDDGKTQKKPSAPIGHKFIYVGIDDSKGFTCYSRSLGPLEFNKQERVGSCANGNIITQGLQRLVFYNEIEDRGHDDLTGQLVNAVLLTPKTKFLRVYTNSEDFLRQEQPTGNFNLSTKTYYVAIDFYIVLKLSSNNCTDEISCNSTQNPFCL